MKMRSISVVLALLAGGGAAQADVRHNVAVKALEQKAQLDARAAERVQEVVDRYRGAIGEIRQSDATALHEIRSLLRNERPDEKRLKKLDEQLLAGRARLQRVKSERLRDLGKVLTPSELGHLLVSWQSVNGAIRRARSS